MNRRRAPSDGCVLYVRVSTARQAEAGVSLNAQRRWLALWAQAQGYRVLGCHVDAGISGGRADNRPALQDALDQACEHGAVLAVYALSRLARSTKDALTIADRLEKAGADLVSLSESIDTTSAAGKMVFRMLAVLAEFERDLVSERTRLALAHKRGCGEKTGGKVPFGYRDDDGQLVEVPQQQEAIRLGLDLYRHGRSFRAIARYWHSQGYTPALMNHKIVASIAWRHLSPAPGQNSGGGTDPTNGTESPLTE